MEPDKWKIVVLGSGGVGKSALTQQWVCGFFEQRYDPPIEPSYIKQGMVDDEPYMVEVIDTPGQEEFSALRDQLNKSGDGFLFIYSLISRTSFDELQNFKSNLDALFELTENQTLPIVLVCNKCDLEAERQIETQEGREVAKELFGSVPFFETSAKVDINVNQAFEQVIREIRKHKTANAKDKSVKQSKRCQVS
eukprot:TRINITY_DN15077_c0_g1_i1.p1 TRINITY_DN15077_c0_g1~~TRINITY_DN15077_c0_g1_i1.p1  ORF type:complete len:194 (-),score=35.20 TRINITY_DN15077_c0_g1_i1:63-644(-)